MRYLIPCEADRRFSCLAFGNESLSGLGQTDMHTSGFNSPAGKIAQKSACGTALLKASPHARSNVCNVRQKNPNTCFA